MTDYDAHLAERQSLLTRLLDAVKQCQVRFGGRRELATDGDSRVSCLCAAWEAVLQYGLRYSNKAFSALKQVSEITGLRKVTRFVDMEPYPAFWQNIKEHLTKHEVQRFLLLKSINTDMGRGRAWLRASLNERSLERYMHMIIEKDDILSQYYEDWSFLRDQERSSMLPNMAAGLGSILFALIIDNPEINSPLSSGIPQAITGEKVKPENKADIKPIISTNKPTVCERKRDRKKKKKLPNIVTFSDDDDQISSISSSPCSIQNDSFDLPARSSLDSPSYLTTRDRLQMNGYGQSDSTITNLGSASGLDGSTEDKSSPKSSGRLNNNNSQSKDSSSKEKSKTASPYHSDETGLEFKFGRKPLLKATDSQSSFLSDDMVIDDNYSAPLSSIHRRLSQGSGSSLEMDSNYCKDLLIPVTLSGVGAQTNKQESSQQDDYKIYSNSDVASAAFALAQAQKSNNNNNSSSSGCSSGSSSSSSNINNSCQSYRTEGDGGNVQQDTHNEMTTSELKKAIVTMMVRKDHVEEQNRSLQQLLSQEKETCLSVRAEVSDLEKKMAVLQEKDNSKIQSLQKENELLRHQLKKYVNAVQLLRKEGTKAEGSLGIHLDELQPVIPPPKSSIDYSHEASEYEKKLIQVAEMHGELIEFNEALHRTIQLKDALIKQLRQELISLHGPLPDEGPSYSDCVSLDVDNLTITPRNLVHVWIPSAFLRGLSSDTYHVYQVYIRIQDEEWNVYRRYRQFYVFYSKLKKKYPILGQFNFPSKVRVGYKDPRVVETRRMRFQAFLRKVISCVIENSTEITGTITKQTVLQYLPFFG
ncbi:sorting nexin-29 [Octopus bimaculoides]|uniref:Sorting nexin-29 n=1 Tax=Octopus bimaculoides TaxID=37653 RepID=A0A0L8GGS4_OCTBM|nr:sorting nexin-29 [Octopus bimaculoides]|eukprot:XP_014781203.1 PREDICTED: sorting nexin-29-like [Octopus bimaculoides]